MSKSCDWWLLLVYLILISEATVCELQHIVGCVGRGVSKLWCTCERCMLLRCTKAIFERLTCSSQELSLPANIEYRPCQQSPQAQYNACPPPPVSDYLQDVGQEKQPPTQHMSPEAVDKHTKMLHMLRAPWPVNLRHVVGFDVCFLAALCVGPRYSPVF